MTQIEVLWELSSRGVSLERQGNRLLYRPRASVDDELRTEMVRHKTALLRAFEDGLIRTGPCEGADCGLNVLYIDGCAWCPAHKMSIRIIDSVMM